jgi:hypothetical protein
MSEPAFYSDICGLFAERPGEQCYFRDYEYEVWDTLLGQHGDSVREADCGMRVLHGQRMDRHATESAMDSERELLQSGLAGAASDEQIYG